MTPQQVQALIDSTPWSNGQGLITGDTMRQLLTSIVGMLGSVGNLATLHRMLQSTFASQSPPLAFQDFLTNYVTESGNTDGTYASVYLDPAPAIGAQFYNLLVAFLVSKGYSSGAANTLLTAIWVASQPVQPPYGSPVALSPSDLPTTLPTGAGVLWNNGGVVSIS
jgi:hypothetical protein